MIGRLRHVDLWGREIAPSDHALTKGDLAAYYTEHLNWTGARVSVAHYTVVEPMFNELDTSDTFESVLDVAELVFANSGFGGRVAVLIPAPKRSMFKVDGETVDPVASADLIAAIQANLRSPAGVALDVYVGGQRRRLMQSR